MAIDPKPAQAPPPSAEPPTPVPVCNDHYDCGACSAYERYAIASALYEVRLAAAPPPQPETLAADEIVERCAAIVESSPTLQKHIQLCFCPECTYVRGNVTEIRALKGTAALAQPQKLAPDALLGHDDLMAVVRALANVTTERDLLRIRVDELTARLAEGKK